MLSLASPDGAEERGLPVDLAVFEFARFVESEFKNEIASARIK